MPLGKSRIGLLVGLNCHKSGYSGYCLPAKMTLIGGATGGGHSRAGCPTWRHWGANEGIIYTDSILMIIDPNANSIYFEFNGKWMVYVII